MIKIELSKDQRRELEVFRKQASSKDSEKALMVLMSNDGKRVPEIAQILKRNAHTIRDWLKRYTAKGIKGLNRKFSPGRPRILRLRVQGYIEEIIENSPLDYDYQDQVWSIPLITFEVNKKLGINASSKTVERALKNMDYVYKRPSKAVPRDAPSREEKKKAIKEMADNIIKIINQEESEIYALDESHFSTEPYLIQGWFKKRRAASNTDTQKKRKPHLLWVLEYKNKKILLEEVR